MALWFRRSHPLAVGVIAGACSLVSGVAGGPALVALFNVAVRGSRRAILAIVALALASTAIFPLLYAGGEPYGLQIVLGVLITGVVVGWGLFVRVQRELVLSLRERAATLEAEQRLRVEQAREAERLRIAREMHDVLAHRVSLLSLHAGALEFHPDASAEEVAEAAARHPRERPRRARGAARRHRRAARGAAGERARAAAADAGRRSPRSSRSASAAGMRVRCQLDVPGDAALPAALGRAAYRIVQEGLTNARKHAPARRGRGDDLGRGGRARSWSRSSAAARWASRAPGPLALPGAGTGLVGLAERVELAGGELEHGPDAAGDFVLRATLPWPA